MPTASAAITPELLAAPPRQVFKSDARSRVWLVDAAGQAVVIKRFEFSPLRQQLALWTGLHPAQREVRANAQLREDGLPVVVILDHKAVRGVPGCRVHIVTPHSGESLTNSLRGGYLWDAARRQRILEKVGQLAGQLIRTGWFFRDLKTSNIIINDQDQPLLIDVGSARRSGRLRHAKRMLAILAHTLQIDGFANELPILLGPVAQACPELGDSDDLLDTIGRIMLK